MRISWWPVVETTLGLFATAVKAATCLVNGHEWIADEAEQREAHAMAYEAARLKDESAVLRLLMAPRMFTCAKCGREERR